MALYIMLKQSSAEFWREGSWNRHSERQPDPTEISGTAKQNRRKSLAFTAEVSLPFPHKNTGKTAEHCRDSRDAKNMNLDDSQPEGKVRNLALIFLCENFPAVSTITVRAGSQ